MSARDDAERARAADRRAVVQQARRLVAEVDALLTERWLQQRASSQIVYKTNWDAWIRPDRAMTHASR